jgi:FlaA1/EpsC-like NDP-sugar epimerase
MSSTVDQRLEVSKSKFPDWLLAMRLPLLILGHAGVFAVAYFAAYLLRFDFQIPLSHQATMWRALPFVLTFQIGIFWLFSTFHGWWRYVTFRDLLSFVPPLLVTGILLFGVGRLLEPLKVPGSIIALHVFLSGGLIMAARSSWRIYSEVLPQVPFRGVRPAKSRALMISNHHDTLVLANQINSQPHSATRIVGILTPDKYPRKAVRAGIPIVGRPHDAPWLKESMNVDQVWLVAGSVPGPQLLNLKTLYDEAGLKTLVIPAATDRGSSGSFIPVREIDIDDLLQRDSVKLDTSLINRQLEGQSIMVTGAGGSIGSEICRQLLKFSPRQLILVDHRENSVFVIHNELLATPNLTTRLVPAVGDILDLPRMQMLFREYQPAIVYHAAAHKHVGLMEENPGQAVQNNIQGTKNIADLADRFGVAKFVLVSTDKAVNPTSVMGCTKQMAERYVLSLGCQSATRYVAVRFGNVLGSAGSVVPIFKEQISRGGPITITDPEMTRYFMTIPEASQLVIQSGCMGNGGEIFVLDMGEPVKIVELARKMIHLAGLPESAIQIRFTGARPGEKLFEELYFDEETMISTPHEKVFAARHRTLNYDQVSRTIETLMNGIHDSPEAIRKQLQLAVPEYHPTSGSIPGSRSDANGPDGSSSSLVISR